MVYLARTPSSEDLKEGFSSVRIAAIVLGRKDRKRTLALAHFFFECFCQIFFPIVQSSEFSEEES